MNLNQAKSGLLICLLAAATISADTVRLRGQAKVDTRIVRLGQIADIESTNTKKKYDLERLELFPAPLDRQVSYTASQIREWMVLRGVRIRELSFSGSNSVTITAVAKKVNGSTLAPTRQAAPLPSSLPAGTNGATRLSRVLTRQAQLRLKQAVVDHFKSTVDDRLKWDVEIEIDRQYLSYVPARRSEIQIVGGKAPWTGLQQMAILIVKGGKQYSIPFAASVELPPLVVVAKRRVGRGHVLRPGDVELRRVERVLSSSTEHFESMERVVGRETTRAFATGQPLTRRGIRNPVVIERRKVVRVIARAGGIRIQTHGRAIEEGGIGEVIRIQPLDSRNSKDFFLARVIGVSEVELFASGPKYTPTRVPNANQTRSPLRRPPQRRLDPVALTKGMDPTNRN